MPAKQSEYYEKKLEQIQDYHERKEEVVKQFHHRFQAGIALFNAAQQKEKIGDRLKALFDHAKQHGGSAKRISSSLAATKSSINKYIYGEIIPKTDVAIACGEAGVNLNWLLRDKGFPFMGFNTEKEIAPVFINYGPRGRDEETARLIGEVLQILDIPLVLDPYISGSVSTSEERIREAIIKSSAAVIALYSGSSVHTPRFEQTKILAQTHNKRMFFAATKCGYDEAGSERDSIYFAGERSALEKMFEDIIMHVSKNEESESAARLLKHAMDRGATEKLDFIVENCKYSWVFIAGSNGEFSDEKGQKMYPEEIKKLEWLKSSKDKSGEYNRRYSNFVEMFVQKLLKKDVKIMSCPEVKSCGAVAIRTARKFGDGHLHQYEIAGHFLDRNLLNKENAKTQNKFAQWLRYVESCRWRYMSRIQTMICIGGSTGTANEIECFKNFLRTIPDGALRPSLVLIPCFGLQSEIEFENMKNVPETCSKCRTGRKKIYDSKYVCTLNKMDSLIKDILENRYCE